MTDVTASKTDASGTVESKASKPAPILAVFDFDHSLIDDNSDTFIVQQLKAELVAPLTAKAKTDAKLAVWTDFMDHVMHQLHEHGFRRADIEKAFAKMPMFKGMITALQELVAAGAHMVILSDANTVFIDTILRAHGCEKLFPADNIYTNPAEWDKDERLRVRWHHTHQCKRCPKNLCKGQVLDAIRQRLLAQRVVYLGDGSGDVCPCLRLTKDDWVLAKRDFRLLSELSKLVPAAGKQSSSVTAGADAPVLAAALHAWADGDEALKLYRAFIQLATKDGASGAEKKAA